MLSIHDVLFLHRYSCYGVQTGPGTPQAHPGHFLIVRIQARWPSNHAVHPDIVALNMDDDRVVLR